MRPEINWCTYDNLIYNKGGKGLQWGKESHFNNLGELDSYMQKNILLFNYTTVKKREYTTLKKKKPTLNIYKKLTQMH